MWGGEQARHFLCYCPGNDDVPDDEVEVRQLKILIVDDSTATRNLAKLLLEKAGYCVRIAKDGKHAIYVLSKFHPDLILMDFGLPDITGIELTRTLKADPATRSIVIIAFTAYTLLSDVEGARAAGCDAFLAKPINPRTFVSQFEIYKDILLPISCAGKPNVVPSNGL
jgi:two-component system, cell cycle response regulator DivK